MKIIKKGFKEACGKLYLECTECGCGFAAGDEDIQRRETGCVYTTWSFSCPFCGERVTVYEYEYDKLHAKLIDKLRRRSRNKKFDQTAKPSEGE